MHVFFSGIGGSGIASLAIVAKQAGFEVSGSDARPSQYLEYLRHKGISDTYVGTEKDKIAAVHAKKPIDWYVYGSAQPRDFPNHPEFDFCKENNIKMTKRDDLINEILSRKNLKLIAIAGTHGKSTTTAMAIWLLKELNVSLSYSVGAKISFGDIGHYEPGSQYFIYEADEFDRNFLAFKPYMSLITGVDWDHPDIYPTREDYYQAFNQFIGYSRQSLLWQADAQRLGLEKSDKHWLLDEAAPEIKSFSLDGLVNRRNAYQVANAIAQLTDKPMAELIWILNRFPGLSRRFEAIAPNLYSDYAHTPGKIRGALQLAEEVGGGKVVVIYEGLHNLRQHFIKADLAHLFDQVKV